MQFSLVLATIFCFTTWMNLVHANHGRAQNCCLQWSTTTIPLCRIKNYTIQSVGPCPITAVKLRTVHGKTLCSNPDREWTKRAMLKVDNETKKLQEKTQTEERSASTITPASSSTSTSKNGPQKNCRNRRQLKKKTRRGKKRQTNYV